MARPARPERSRSARSSRQLSRFYHSINPDRVFGTHNRTIQTDRRREYTVTPEMDRYGQESKKGGRLHLIIGSRGAGKCLVLKLRFLCFVEFVVRGICQKIVARS